MRRAVVLVVVAALSAVACGSASGGSNDVSLTFGYSNTRGKSRFELRVASGAFDRTDYRLSWAAFDSGELALEALLAGSVDIQEVQPTSLVNVAGNAKEPWTAESAPVAVVGALRYTTPEGIQIVVRGGSGIDSVAGLKGKKVAFTRGSSSNYYLAAKLKDAGLSLSDVEQVKLKLSEARAAFEAGEVDAIVAFDFNILAVVRTGVGRVIARSSDDNLPLYALIAVRRSLLKKSGSRSAISDMLSRMGDFERWVGANATEARRLTEALDGIDPLDSENFVRFGLAERVPVTAEVIAAVQDQVDVFHEQEVVANRIDASVLFDSSLNPK